MVKIYKSVGAGIVVKITYKNPGCKKETTQTFSYGEDQTKAVKAYKRFIGRGYTPAPLVNFKPE